MMNPQLLAIVTCLIIGSTYAQGNQDSVLNDSGIGCNLNVGSNMGSTELDSSQKLDISVLQKLIDDASDGSSIKTDDDYVSSQTLHINKNVTLVGSPVSIIDAQGASQILKIDNPKASVTMENFVFMRASGDYGGAISSQAKSLTIRDCRFLDNSANYGAGIHQKGGILQVMDSTFEGNNASIWGAAIHVDGGDIQAVSSKFTQNPGRHVISVNGTQPNQAKVSIKGCEVSNNPGPYGTFCDPAGAIACVNSTAIINRCTIEGNKALINTKMTLCGINAGLYLVSSNVTLNDTLIERNEAIDRTAMDISKSNVMMNHCSISRNRARSIFFDGTYRPCYVAGVYIDPKSEVTMEDVTFEGNIADGDYGAIANSGTLNVGRDVVISRNTANRYSAFYNLETGIMNMRSKLHMLDNRCKEGCESFRSDGIIKGSAF
jgi:hypothetical protein